MDNVNKVDGFAAVVLFCALRKLAHSRASWRGCVLARSRFDEVARMCEFSRPRIGWQTPVRKNRGMRPVRLGSSAVVVGAFDGGGVDMAIVGDVFKANGDLFRDPRLLHRHAVERGGRGHGLLRVGHNDETRPAEKIFEHVDESTDVGLVERCVDFV